MKTRLNLTIDNDVLSRIKAYADKKHISISELVENYFQRIAKPTSGKNIITLVEKLEKPVDIDKTADLKELFYKEQGKKYGF